MLAFSAANVPCFAFDITRINHASENIIYALRMNFAIRAFRKIRLAFKKALYLDLALKATIGKAF